MNRYESLQEKFASCAKIQGTTMIMLDEPLLLEKMLHPELDFILMDAEHGRFDTQNVIPMLHTCRMLGMPSFVRVQDSQYHLIAKAIDMGADGVMIPRVETLEQLRTVVDAVWFGPIGRKGAGGYGQFRAGEDFPTFQKSRFVMIQIESQKGVDNLESMLSQYGDFLSAVIIGPNDHEFQERSGASRHPKDIRHLPQARKILRYFLQRRRRRRALSRHGRKRAVDGFRFAILSARLPGNDG